MNVDPTNGHIECNDCGCYFAGTDEWLLHYYLQHIDLANDRERPKVCVICGLRFFHLPNLTRHLKCYLRRASTDPEGEDNDGGGCHVAATSTNHLARIVDIPEEDYSIYLACAACCLLYETVSELYAHYFTFHWEDGHPTYVCPLCHRRFPLRALLIDHCHRHRIKDRPCGVTAWRHRQSIRGDNV